MPTKVFQIFNFVRFFLKLLEIPGNFLLQSYLQSQLYYSYSFLLPFSISPEGAESEAVAVFYQKYPRRAPRVLMNFEANHHSPQTNAQP